MRHDLERTNQPRAAETGQTMAEYAVVLSVLVIGILAAFVLIGDSSGNLVTRVADIL